MKILILFTLLAFSISLSAQNDDKFRTQIGISISPSFSQISSDSFTLLHLSGLPNACFEFGSNSLSVKFEIGMINRIGLIANAKNFFLGTNYSYSFLEKAHGVDIETGGRFYVDRQKLHHLFLGARAGVRVSSISMNENQFYFGPVLGINTTLN